VLSEDLVNAIQQLLILGKGDSGRLEYALDLLRKGRALPESDQKYLQNIISLYLGSKEPELYQKNMESTVEQLHQEIQRLNEKIDKFEKQGFEKYVGRKTILFFITVFVGWNALQSFIQQSLGTVTSSDLTQYLFPLRMVLSHYNSDLPWFVFVIVLLAWPFIGSIHLVKFIQSRKRLKK
jgi:hypothetical protein